MTEPKDVHERDQEFAELLEDMVHLAAATAAYFNRLVDDGLERHEALRLTRTWITANSTGATNAEDDESGEDWKKDE